MEVPKTKRLVGTRREATDARARARAQIYSCTRTCTHKINPILSIPNRCASYVTPQRFAAGGGGGGGGGFFNQAPQQIPFFQPQWKVCHRCGSPDHLIKDCPLPPKGKGKAGKGGKGKGAQDAVIHFLQDATGTDPIPENATG